jgi:hypothetical protein
MLKLGRGLYIQNSMVMCRACLEPTVFSMDSTTSTRETIVREATTQTSRDDSNAPILHVKLMDGRARLWQSPSERTLGQNTMQEFITNAVKGAMA